MAKLEDTIYIVKDGYGEIAGIVRASFECKGLTIKINAETLYGRRTSWERLEVLTVEH